MDGNLKRDNRKGTRTFKDLVTISIIAILLLAISNVFHVFERFAAFHEKHGVAPVDEFIIVFAILSLALMVYSYRRWTELREALANIKILQGLLPICASCKKIRDDKGYWNKLEAYIEGHSEAEVISWICPECMKKLYGSFLKKDTGSKKQ